MLFTLAMVLAAAPLKVASSDWSTSGVDPTLAGALESRFVQLLREAGLQVTSSKDVGAILGLERQKQLLGCANESCSAELAGALGVDAMLFASVAIAGSGYTVSVRVISAANGQAISALSGRVKSLDELQDWLDAGAKKMASELKGEVAVAAPTTPLVRWIPAIAGGVVGVGGLIVFLERNGPAMELEQRVFPDRATVKSTRGAGEGLETAGIVLMAVGGAAIVTSVFWAALAPADSLRVSLAPIPGGAALSMRGAFP